MKTFYGRRERDGCRIWVGEGPESDSPAERRLAETELPGCPELFKGQVLSFA